MSKRKAAAKKKAPAKKVVKKSRAKTPTYEKYPEWTEARYWQFIRSLLRSGWSKHPVKYKVLAKATRPYKGPDKRRKKEAQCNECKGWFKLSEVSVDHIIPAGSLKSWDDLAGFAQRLLDVAESDLQVLCTKQCHAKKTALERAAAKEIK